jgi:hypothetical protein
MDMSYEAQEARIKQAREYKLDHPKEPWTNIATKFHVRYQRLLAREKGRKSKSELSNHTKLTKEEENVLKDRVRRWDSLGMRATHTMLNGAANDILELRTINDPDSDKLIQAPLRVGSQYGRRFQKRNADEFMWKVQKPLSAQRNRITPDIVRDHFWKLQHIITEFGIAPSDLWNFDQTGFSIGIGGDVKVLTSVRNKNVRLFMADPENRTHLTSVECINAEGSLLPPFLVMKGETIMHNDIASTLPGDWTLSCTETGYVNTSIMLEWLRIFEKQTRSVRAGRYRLLIFDGFESHTDFEFVRYCEMHDIVPYVLPAHSTHLLQPCDVGCFQPLKHWHTEAVADSVRTGFDTFHRVDFLYALRKIRTQAFKPNTIRKAWKLTGILPFKIDIILNKLPTYEEDTFSSSESDGFEHQYHITPQSIRQIRNSADYLVHSVRKFSSLITAEFPLALEKYLKGANQQALKVHLLEKQTEDLLSKVTARTRRRNAGRKQVATGKILTTGESRQIITNQFVSQHARRYGHTLTLNVRARMLSLWINRAALIGRLIHTLPTNKKVDQPQLVDSYISFLQRTLFKCPRWQWASKEWIVREERISFPLTGGYHVVELKESDEVHFADNGPLPPVAPSELRPTRFDILQDTISDSVRRAQLFHYWYGDEIDQPIQGFEEDRSSFQEERTNTTNARNARETRLRELRQEYAEDRTALETAIVRMLEEEDEEFIIANSTQSQVKLSESQIMKESQVQSISRKRQRKK